MMDSECRTLEEVELNGVRRAVERRRFAEKERLEREATYVAALERAQAAFEEELVVNVGLDRQELHRYLSVDHPVPTRPGWDVSAMLDLPDHYSIGVNGKTVQHKEGEIGVELRSEPYSCRGKRYALLCDALADAAFEWHDDHRVEVVSEPESEPEAAPEPSVKVEYPRMMPLSAGEELATLGKVWIMIVGKEGRMYADHAWLSPHGLLEYERFGLHHVTGLHGGVVVGEQIQEASND